jgi:hypothetical protein
MIDTHKKTSIINLLAQRIFNKNRDKKGKYRKLLESKE